MKEKDNLKTAEVRAWFEGFKKRYQNDSIAKALKEGRLGVRTFAKNDPTNINHHNTNASGKIGLEHLLKMLNPTYIDQSEKIQKNKLLGVSASIFPSKLFLPANRIAILFTLPEPIDIQKYKTYTAKQYIQEHEIDTDLVTQIKTTVSRIGYFSKDDLGSKLYVENGKYKVKSHKENAKSNSLNYKEVNQNEKSNYNLHNEAIVKLRYFSKYAITAFNEADLKKLIEKNTKAQFPNKTNVCYALLDEKKQTIKIISKEEELKIRGISIENADAALEENRLALKTKLEELKNSLQDSTNQVPNNTVKKK